jgi:hypothetical protein
LCPRYQLDQFEKTEPEQARHKACCPVRPLDLLFVCHVQWLPFVGFASVTSVIDTAENNGHTFVESISFSLKCPQIARNGFHWSRWVVCRFLMLNVAGLVLEIPNGPAELMSRVELPPAAWLLDILTDRFPYKKIKIKNTGVCIRDKNILYR